MNKSDINIKIAEQPEDFKIAREIILEYTDWLGFDLSFQNFDNEINHLDEIYAKPNGALILATIDDVTVGVLGLRRFENSDGELKRMYVKGEYRNRGIGRLLIKRALEIARKFGYKIIKLDTSGTMEAAIKLYREFGFVERDAYRYNPHESAKYFELKLD